MKLKQFNSPIYYVVADGMMSNPDVGDGRLIPGVVVDTREDETLIDLINLHETTPPGDSKSTWIKKILDQDTVILLLEFSKPMVVALAIQFKLSEQYSIVDGIINSKALYLSTGKHGDKFSKKLSDSILIEIPNTGFENYWETKLVKIIKRKINKTHNTLSRKDCMEIVREQINEMRSAWSFRR